MAGEKGRDFVLKKGDGASSESFTTIGGGRVLDFEFTSEDVSQQDKDDVGWETLLANAGKKQARITLQGIFKDSATEALMIADAIDQSVDNYEVYFANGDKFEFAAKISNMRYSGPDNDATQYTFNLTTSGEIAFTAA